MSRAPAGVDRPLSALALDALVVGDAHPSGHVFAPLGTSQALLRRGLVAGERGATIAHTFGDNVRTDITPAGRRAAASERLRRLDAELNPPATIPEPSWEVFAPCSTCSAGTGVACTGGSGRPLRNPHAGRRQLGPRADSLVHRTGAAR